MNHLPTFVVPGSWRGVLRRFREAPLGIQIFASHYPDLIEKFPWDVSVGYLFSKVESGHRLAAYCGAVKKWRTDPRLTWSAVSRWYKTRGDVARLLSDIYAADFPKHLTAMLDDAERVRDAVLHGGEASEAEHRRAVVRVLDYLEGLELFTLTNAKVSPFPDLRGFSGRAAKLDTGTSRLVLKGLGFQLQ